MAKMQTREGIKKQTIKNMEALGTYKEQYNQIIDIYVDMLYQYQELRRQFAEGGYQASVETERSGGKKNPVLVSLENLRKDIGTYSDRLMLNAKAYANDIEPPKQEKSVFAKLLEGQKDV